jgi:hypothetical protein
MGKGLYSKSLSFFERIIDIILWFFSGNALDAITLTNIQFIIAIVALIIFVYVLKRYVDNKSFTIFGIILLSTIMLYVVSALPMTPSRHQLILILPLAGLLCILIFKALTKCFSEHLQIKLCWIVLLCVSSLQFFEWQKKEAHFPSTEVELALEKSGAQQLVLSPCDYQPLFIKEIREQYNPVYRCGNLIAKTLTENTFMVGIWAEDRINEKIALAVLSDYSDAAWSIESIKFFENDLNNSFGSLFIASKITKRTINNE